MSLEIVTLVHTNGFGIPQAMTSNERQLLVNDLRKAKKNHTGLFSFPYSRVEILRSNGSQEVLLLD